MCGAADATRLQADVDDKEVSVMSDFETPQHDGEASEPELRLAIRDYVASWRSATAPPVAWAIRPRAAGAGGRASWPTRSRPINTCRSASSPFPAPPLLTAVGSADHHSDSHLN